MAADTAILNRIDQVLSRMAAAATDNPSYEEATKLVEAFRTLRAEAASARKQLEEQRQAGLPWLG